MTKQIRYLADDTKFGRDDGTDGPWLSAEDVDFDDTGRVRGIVEQSFELGIHHFEVREKPEPPLADGLYAVGREHSSRDDSSDLYLMVGPAFLRAAGSWYRLTPGGNIYDDGMNDTVARAGSYLRFEVAK